MFLRKQRLAVESSVSAEHKNELAESSVSTEHRDVQMESSVFNELATDEIQWDADPFAKMCNLRLLKICNVSFSRCPEYFSKELRLLEWSEYPSEFLPSSFKPCQLVELKMTKSRITQLWHGSCTMMENLVQMDLSNSIFLIKTPDFRKVPNLERLILEGCEKLSEVHATIGDLQRLVVLNMKGCENLESLPHSISLESLKTFKLSGCSKLKEFPEIVGNMEALSELYLDGTAIRKLPASIQQLKGLTLLNLNGCKNLTGFPMAICSLTPLRYLSLSGCSRIDILPVNVGSVLQLLDLSENGFVSLPESISQLSKLRELSLFRCRKLQSLPKLPLSIKFIDVRHCPKLPTSKNLTVWTAINGFSFMICGNSDEDEDRTRHPLAVHEELDDELFFSKYIEDRIYHDKPFEIRAHFPDSTRVPNWCRHWMSGSSVRAKLPIDTEGSNSRCMGFALFVAFEILENEKFQKSWELEKTVCHFSTREGRLEHAMVFQNFEDYRVGTSYGLCCYEPRGGQFARQLNEGSRQFEASVTTNRPDLEVKGCGIHFIWQQDVADFVNNLIPIANHRQHPGFELWSTLESSGAEMVLVYDRSMGTSMNFPL